MWRLESAAAFAIATMVASLLVSLQLEHKRVRLERPFFVGAPKSAITLLSLSTAGVNAIGRSIAVGAIALFSFATPKTLGGVAGVDAAQVEADFIATAAVMGGFIALCVVASLVLDTWTRRRGHRWVFYRFPFVIGLMFSAVVFTVSERTSASTDPIFAPIPWEGIKGALKDVIDGGGGGFACEALKVPADVGARDEWKRPDGLVAGHAWRTNGCGQVFTPNLCRDFRDNNAKYLFLGDVHWNNHGCGGPQRTISTERLLGISTIVDGFLDQLIRGAISSIVGDRGWVSEVLTLVLPVVISSNVLQGLVICTYAAALLLVVAGARVRAESAPAQPL